MDWHKQHRTPLSTAPVELRAAVAARRQIVLTADMGMGGGAGIMRFTINGREFNKARTDTTVAAGNVEEWTLTNTSPMDHPFQLHVCPMKTAKGQTPPDGRTW